MTGGFSDFVTLQQGLNRGSEGLGEKWEKWEGRGVLGSDGLFWRIVPQADGRGEVRILTHKLQLDKAAQKPDGSAGDGQLTEVQHRHIPQDCVLDARVLEVLPKL